MSTGKGFKLPSPVVSFRLSTCLRRLGLDCGVDNDTLDYCVSRCKAEGTTFLTKTLPQLSKAVLQSLEIGKFQRPTNFAWSKGSLRYFRSLLCVIFDDQGWVLPNPDPDALRRLRQFCEYFYKLALSFTPNELNAAANKYLTHENGLGKAEESLCETWVDRLRKNLETYYPYLAKLHAWQIFSHSRPRYTPGAFYGSSDSTRQAILANGRIVRATHWSGYKSLPYSPGNPTVTDGLSPYSGYFREYPSCRSKIYSSRHGRTENKLTRKLTGQTSTVLFVPKDSRGPRVISKEPLVNLRAQMSYFDTVSELLESRTSGRIMFSDQTVNQSLAREGSVTKFWATLDMRDASDSVLLKLVNKLFRNCPGLSEIIRLSRSTHTTVNNKTVKLKKLAGMGSGLTFPTMALLIHLSVCTYVALKTGLPYSEVTKMVYVYGDDLIVPRVWVDHAVKGLTLTQFNVNTDKSFAKGFFRESCGADFYMGEDVSIVRMRLSAADLPTARKLTERRTKVTLRSHGILQLERHVRELTDKGLLSTADYLYDCLETWYGRKLPYVSRHASALGRYDSTVEPTSLIEEGYVPVPIVEDISDTQCPYKYLGKTLRPRDSSLLAMFESETVTMFGDLSLPRALKLKRRQLGFAQKTALIDCI